jgi:predicted metallopeptidase
MDGFDFTAHTDRLCRDMVARVPDLRHIRMDCVGLSFAQTRNGSAYGLYASVTPLRFDGGGRVMERRGRRWALPRIVDRRDREMLYVLSFYLPRYLNLSCREKLATVAHELWHISPACDGQLRRLGDRFHAHGKSQKAYDAQVARLVEAYLAADPPEGMVELLQLDFAGLQRRYGRVTGQRIRVPKLIPVE